MKAFLEIGGASLTLIGVIVGVYGTYLMTKFYHPYGPLGFTKSIVKMLWRTLFFQSERAKRHNEVAAKFAKLREEDKGESLAGVHWLFMGFVLQTAGAVLIMIDAILLHAGSAQPG